jgi:hypothetical protein
LAAGDISLAQTIIELSPIEFLKQHEYEDDYCYARILHGLVSGQEELLGDMLSRFAVYLEGIENGRLLVARALTNRNQDGFDAGFQALLLDRQKEIAKDVERRQVETPEIIAARRVFIEGLAILRLAEQVGLATEQEYLFCPSLARIPMTRPFPGE